jgi:hypothetical protein
MQLSSERLRTVSLSNTRTLRDHVTTSAQVHAPFNLPPPAAPAVSRPARTRVAPRLIAAAPAAGTEHSVVMRLPSARNPVARELAATAPLVWRKSAPVAHELTAPAQAVAHSAAAVTAPPAPPAAVRASKIDMQQAREVLRTTLVEDSVVDRLADDVMKRVDKRLRIERERRGL